LVTPAFGGPFSRIHPAGHKIGRLSRASVRSPPFYVYSLLAQARSFFPRSRCLWYFHQRQLMIPLFACFPLNSVHVSVGSPFEGLPFKAEFQTVAPPRPLFFHSFSFPPLAPVFFSFISPLSLLPCLFLFLFLRKVPLRSTEPQSLALIGFFPRV